MGEVLSASGILAAVEIYLRHAYPDVPLPKSVTATLDALRSSSEPGPTVPPFIKSPEGGDRYTLRLGNRHYPHMKLIIEKTPGGTDCWLFRPDTHDRHICPPPTSRDYQAFVELRVKNQRIAEAIEAAWAEAGVLTFKTFLHRDLERRKAQRAGGLA